MPHIVLYPRDEGLPRLPFVLLDYPMPMKNSDDFIGRFAERDFERAEARTVAVHIA